MKRLLSRGIWDVRLQFRNGFYYAAGVVVLLLIILLAWLPPESLTLFLPVALLGNLTTNGFYFMAGLMLLEKAEGSLEAQVVTPLRDWEYLLAKVATLCLLSLAESVAIVGLAHGPGPDWLALLAGVMLMAATLACCGFLLVVRYDSINAFLPPSILATMLLALPLLDLLGGWSSSLWYLHPLHASLVLVGAGFEPVSPAELGAAMAVGVVWTVVTFILCRRAFRRFVITGAATP